MRKSSLFLVALLTLTAAVWAAEPKDARSCVIQAIADPTRDGGGAGPSTPIAGDTAAIRPVIQPPKVDTTPRCPNCGGEDTKMRFNDLYGEVSYRCESEEDDAYEFAELDTVIYANHRIRTKEESGAILSLEDMSTFVLKPESILVVRAEEDTRSNFEQKFDMLKGRIIGNVKKLLEGKSMGFEMSQCVSGIKGTVFVLEETGTESRAWLFTSKMDVTSKKTGKTISLKPGQMSRVGSDGVVRLQSFDVKEMAKKFGISEKDLREGTPAAGGKPKVELPVPEPERRAWERPAAKKRKPATGGTGKLVAHLSFDDYGNGGLNALKASVGYDGIVCVNPDKDIEGLGEVTCVTDRSVLAGLPAGDGAVLIPARTHIALPIPSVLEDEPGRPYTIQMKVKFRDFKGYNCLLNMPADNRTDVMVFLERKDDPAIVFKHERRVVGKGGFAAGRWQTLTIQFMKNRTRATLDGQEVFAYDCALLGSRADCSKAKGFFLLSADDTGEDEPIYWADVKVFDGASAP